MTEDGTWVQDTGRGGFTDWKRNAKAVFRPLKLSSIGTLHYRYNFMNNQVMNQVFIIGFAPFSRKIHV